MNYEHAGQVYLDTERELALMDAEHKARCAPLKEKLLLLEQWITSRAQEDGLENVKTAAGTVYWSNHQKATVANRDAFFSHCQATGAWDLLEARAAKTAVKSFVEAHGTPPPGVDYATVRVFNFRKTATKEST